MNVIDPQDATPHDADTDAPRRWTASTLRNRFQAGFWVLFVGFAAAISWSFLRYGGLMIVFVALWWGAVVVIGVRALRTATRVELYGDGSLLLIAPIRVVHTQVSRVESLRGVERGDERGRWTEPDAVLETADGAMRLPRGLVTEDLVDALR